MTSAVISRSCLKPILGCRGSTKAQPAVPCPRHGRAKHRPLSVVVDTCQETTDSRGVERAASVTEAYERPAERLRAGRAQ